MILEVSKGFPYYTQQIASELFNMTEKTVSDDMVTDAITSILEKEEDLFLNEWHHLSQQQKKALKFLIHFGGEKIYQKEKIIEFNFTSSSLKKAVEGLVAKDVIDTKKNCYDLQDPLFELFLSRI